MSGRSLLSMFLSSGQKILAVVVDQTSEALSGTALLPNETPPELIVLFTHPLLPQLRGRLRNTRAALVPDQPVDKVSWQVELLSVTVGVKGQHSRILGALHLSSAKSSSVSEGGVELWVQLLLLSHPVQKSVLTPSFLNLNWSEILNLKEFMHFFCKPCSVHHN